MIGKVEITTAALLTPSAFTSSDPLCTKDCKLSTEEFNSLTTACTGQRVLCALSKKSDAWNQSFHIATAEYNITVATIGNPNGKTTLKSV